jgi:hypothetical protein
MLAVAFEDHTSVFKSETYSRHNNGNWRTRASLIALNGEIPAASRYWNRAAEWSLDLKRKLRLQNPWKRENDRREMTNAFNVKLASVPSTKKTGSVSACARAAPAWVCFRSLNHVKPRQNQPRGWQSTHTLTCISF